MQIKHTYSLTVSHDRKIIFKYLNLYINSYCYDRGFTNQAKSVKDSNFASSFTDFASHFFCFVEFIRLLKECEAKSVKDEAKLLSLTDFA